VLVSIALCLAGRPGARLAAALKIWVAKDTLLNLLRALPDPPASAVRVLGVDDFIDLVVCGGGTSSRALSEVAGEPARSGFRSRQSRQVRLKNGAPAVCGGAVLVLSKGVAR
jgi:hypothetical protein